MAHDCNASRKIIMVIPSALRDRDYEQGFQIEALGQDTALAYEESGVKFYREDEIKGENLAARIVEAVNIIKGIPSLFKTVAELVRSVHLVDAGGDDYDVSFSDPHIPFTIFVSVQRVPGEAGVLRAVEAIVHEAMHLQLTLIERIVALTGPAGGTYFSPWRQEYRDARGLLHALYVFHVIDKFFEEIVAIGNARSPVGYEHIRSRRNEISRQMRAVKSFQGSPELTSLGADFVKNLLQDD